MARLNVNPTRMELLRLKQRLSTAKRGYKLLKDKSDEMIRQFMVYIKQNKEFRNEVEKEMKTALSGYVTVRSRMTSQEAFKAVSVSDRTYSFVPGLINIMGLNVPKITVNEKKKNMLPYSLVSNSVGLDKSIMILSKLLDKIIKLAEVEKICTMLAENIEKSRRRINALEYVIIPNIEETMKFIVMKLDENELGNRVRLMKVKEKYKNN